MFDPDAGHRPTLRLGAKLAAPSPEDIAEANRAAEAYAEHRKQHPDARPRTMLHKRMASGVLATAEAEMEAAIARWSSAYIDWVAAYAQAQPISAQRQPTEQTNRQHLARYDQSDPLWRLHMGEHDTRVHQHAAGPVPLVFRASGHVERFDKGYCLDAPLYEDDGA